MVGRLSQAARDEPLRDAAKSGWPEYEQHIEPVEVGLGGVLRREGEAFHYDAGAGLEKAVN